MTTLFTHPLWLAGFRPFFVLALVSGALLPLSWALVFGGFVALPAWSLPALQWHAHEMFYGFGWAVLGGFLLTASKNWVGTRGIHGGPLALAAALWLVERFAVLWAGLLPEWLRPILLNAFVGYVGAYVCWTLIKHRKNDSFRDNGFFLVALPLFVVAKTLTLGAATFPEGFALTLGLFRVAFVVMLERTVPQFMKNAHAVALPRHAALDWPIKAVTLLAAFEAFLPAALAVTLLATAATLLLVRFFLWKPLVGLRRFDIGVMYVGYLGLTAHLILQALRLTGWHVGLGALATHVFTFVCMGIIIPGMLVRICQGHTGRPLRFAPSDRVAIGAMAVASFFRLGATQLWPERYAAWITVAGAGWAVCFTLLGVRLAPFLFAPRVDGREH